MNEKKTYYVSVQAGTVLEDKEAAAFEFEIRATEKELNKLRLAFEEVDDAATDTFFRSGVPGVPYHYDKENDVYDDALVRVYRMIYDLGTPETKKHIENMGVLQPPLALQG